MATASQGINTFDSGWNWYHSGNSGLVSDLLNTVVVAGERIWVGANSAESSVFDPNWRTFRAKNGLADDMVHAILTESGQIWFGTSNGLSRFDGTTWATYTGANSGDPLPHSQVQAVAKDSSGHYWFGTPAGIAVFDGASSWTYHNQSNGLPGNDVRALAMDAQGHMWAATAAGAALYDGGWVTFDSSNTPLTSDDIQALALDRRKAHVGRYLWRRSRRF